MRALGVRSRFRFGNMKRHWDCQLRLSNGYLMIAQSITNLLPQSFLFTLHLTCGYRAKVKIDVFSMIPPEDAIHAFLLSEVDTVNGKMQRGKPLRTSCSAAFSIL